jgi:selenocysteine-specific elongation factor
MRSIVVGTAGHIDHGKSALVMALTGTDPDRLKEEKARGITIDLGFAHAVIAGVNFAFVDVPGHERFVKNMLAGVGGIDLVLLVIAADESVMPQTREHFDICRLLQVRSGLVVLTKADLVDAETLELARVEAGELVAGSSLQDAPILAVSSKTGEGLDALRAALVEAAASAPPRGGEGAPRLPVDRVFSMRGFGTVVTGTLTAGSIQADTELVALPGGRRVKVRGIQVHGSSQPSAAAGRRVAVNLGGVDVADLSRGETLTTPGAFDVTRRFDAALDLLPGAPPIRHGQRVRFHHGTSEILGRVALAAEAAASAGSEDPADDRKDPASDGGADQSEAGRVFRPGVPPPRLCARLRLEAPAVLTRGDRFVLRQYSPPITIGGGVVLDPAPARTPIRTPAGTERFRRLSGADAEAAMVFVEERRGAGIEIDALARRTGLSPGRARTLADTLAAGGKVIVTGDEVFGAPLARALETRLLDSVAEHHRLQPLAEGLPREEARARVFALASPALFEYAVRELAEKGKLTGRDRLALPGRGVSLTAEESRAQDALVRVFKGAGLAPPDLAAAAQQAGVSAPLATRMSSLMMRQKVLVKLDTLLFHADALESLKRDVAAMKSQPGARVDVAGFKERYGISRKYAIPLLEWLDRERVTRRVGDARVIL